MSGKAISIEKFIFNAKQIHGERYDYSKFEYVNSSVKSTIICEKHGEFLQSPRNHMKGYNCKKCMYEGERTLPSKHTLESFIIKSNEVHDNKYDYSKVVYKNNKQPIIIICPEHGEFNQRPDSHLSGRGCIYCSGTYQYAKEDFIKKSNEKHNNKYDYSEVLYTKNDNKVTIICNKHGKFSQLAKDHLRGRGCDICSGGYVGTKEIFLAKSFEVHGNTYNYDNVKYVNNQTKVDIICNKHGIFKQRPAMHLFGNGCPKCSNFSKGEIKITKILEEKNIIFTYQKTFDDCKNVFKLPFDFYLPDYNTCVEFDGAQHFKAFKYFGGEKTFKARQLNDQIKNKYCKNNNIPLLRIPYWDFKNIETILTDYLKSILINSN